MLDKAYSVLNAINDIDFVNKTAEESVYDAMNSEYDKLYNMAIMSESYYQESIGSAVKKGAVFIIRLLKKVIGMIRYGINVLISLISKIFKRHKNMKDANNILANIGVSQINEFFIESLIPKTSSEKIFYIDINGNSMSIKPSPSTRKMISKINKNINFFDKKEDAEAARKQYGALVITFIKHPEIFGLLKGMVHLFNIENGNIVCDKNKITKVHSEYVKNATEELSQIINNIEKNIATVVNLNNIKKLNAEVVNLQKYIDNLFNAASKEARADSYINNNFGVPIIDYNKAYSDGNERVFVDMLNQELININIGINGLIHDIKEIGVVSKEYHNSISDENKIDEFISDMLSSGYTSNMVYTNIKVCVKNDMYETIKTGQTRAVLIDNKHEFVLKCALNSSGLSANKTESQIYDVYRKHGMNQYLAAIIKTYENNCVLKQEYCKDINDVSIEERDALYNEIDMFCKKYNIDVIADRKPDAVGRRIDDNKPVVVDYGIRSRFAAVV